MDSNLGSEESLILVSEDVRVVKETVSSSVDASRKGSNPFPRNRSLGSKGQSTPLTSETSAEG